MDEDNSLWRQGKKPMMEPAAPTSEVRGIRSKGDQKLVAKVPLGHLGPPAHPMTLQNPCKPTKIWKPQGPGYSLLPQLWTQGHVSSQDKQGHSKGQVQSKGPISAGFPRGPARHTSRRHPALNHLPGNIDGKLNKA